MTEVSHHTGVSFGPVEIGPFDRRAAGESLIPSFFLIRLHDRLKIKSHARFRGFYNPWISRMNRSVSAGYHSVSFLRISIFWL